MSFACVNFDLCWNKTYHPFIIIIIFVSTYESKKSGGLSYKICYFKQHLVKALRNNRVRACLLNIDVGDLVHIGR